MNPFVEVEICFSDYGVWYCFLMCSFICLFILVILTAFFTSKLADNRGKMCMIEASQSDRV